MGSGGEGGVKVAPQVRGAGTSWEANIRCEAEEQEQGLWQVQFNIQMEVLGAGG